MNIRALCTDIDGTLLNSDRQLSTRTIAAIKSLSAKMPIILASSRMPSAMRHLQLELGILNHPLICYNGGYVIHLESDSTEIVDSVKIPADICSSIVSLIKGTNLHVSLFEEDDWYAQTLDQWTEREERITKVSPKITDLDSVLNGWHDKATGAHKVMCMGPEQEVQKLEMELANKFSDQLHLYRSKSTYLEISPRTISKATALQLLLKESFDIDPKEVIAFGDNYNDIDLLKSVGLGIAVENARDEVKAVAKEITLNSKEDGVAIAIEKHLII